MAYCPRCGVEIDNNFKKCPLCDFPIPDISESKQTENLDKFPRAKNMYPQKLEAFRNKLFITFFLLSIESIIILFSIGLYKKSISNYTTGVIFCITVAMIYVFLLMGYITSIRIVVASIGATTIIFNLLLDYINGTITWSLTYSLPITISAVMIFTIMHQVYKKSKHKTHFIFIPIYICIGLSIFILIIEVIISLNIYNSMRLSWSLIVFVSLLGFSGILTSLYYKLPEIIKEKMNRIFHV